MRALTTATRGSILDAVVVASIAVAARLAWLWHQPPVTAWDGIIYHRTALRIARGLGFIDSWTGTAPLHPTAFYPVGYPALLALGHRAFGPSLWVAAALNLVAAGVTAVAVVVLARRAWGRRAAWLAGSLFALAPGAVMYVSTFMTESVSAALLVGALGAAARHGREGRPGSALLAGLLLGAGGLVRPQTLLLAPVVAWWSAPSTELAARARTLALVGLACIAAVLPWTARNCAVLDGCALVSVNGGSNLWIGTDPDARGSYRDLHPGEGCDRVHGEVAKDRCYGRLALRRILRAPRAWLALAPLKASVLMDYEGAPVWYLRAAGAPPRDEAAGLRVAALLTAFHRALCALALLAVLPLAGRRAWRPETRLATAVVAASIATHMAFFGGDRYHFVFTPLLCLLAGGVLAHDDPG